MTLGSKTAGDKLGRYRLVERIGAGGMAEVFRARAEGEGGFAKDLVIKMILPVFAHEEKFIGLFMNEALLAARLDHPNIVHVFDFGTVEGRHFLAMELVRGYTLRAIRAACRKYHRPISPEIVARIISGAAQGLDYAHHLTDEDGQALGITHRDVSSDNIIVSHTGTPKLLDFGIAKAAAVSPASQGTLKGKYAYLSPEQVMGEHSDHRSDIYALGVVLYEMLTGERPYSRSQDQLLQMLEDIVEGAPRPIRDLRDDAPAALVAIASRAMQKRPRDRYQSAREMHVELEAYITSTGESVLDFHVQNYLEELYRPSGALAAQPAARASATHTVNTDAADSETDNRRSISSPDALGTPSTSAARAQSIASVAGSRMIWVVCLALVFTAGLLAVVLLFGR